MKNRGFIVMIVLLCALVLAVTISTLVVGSRQFDGVVTERPYETGLAWDEVQKRQQRLGWKIILEETTYKKGGNDLYLTIVGREGKRLESLLVRLTISRPASRVYDRTYEARQLSNGRFIASIDLPVYGYWDLHADIRQGTQQFDYRARIYAQE